MYQVIVKEWPYGLEGKIYFLSSKGTRLFGPYSPEDTQFATEQEAWAAFGEWVHRLSDLPYLGDICQQVEVVEVRPIHESWGAPG